MPAPATRNAGLVLELSSQAVPSLRVVGTLPGVVVVGAAARNGPGSGMLSLLNGLMSWTAPGSSNAGPAVNVAAGGNFMLEDGTDASQWVSVTTYATYLPAAAQAQVEFEDSYATGPTEVDVAAANALAGQTTIAEYALTNLTANALANVKLWLDPTASGEPELSVSTDGVTYYQPTSSTDAHVMSWASVAAGAGLNLWVKRVTPASSASDAGLLNMLQWTWQGIN